MTRFVKWLVLPAVLLGAAVFAAPLDAQAQGWGVSFYGGNPYGGYYAPSYGSSYGYGGYGGGYSSYSYRAFYGNPYTFRNSYYGGGYPVYRSYYGGGHHHHHHHHCD
jgi:hypothetical protein